MLDAAAMVRRLDVVISRSMRYWRPPRRLKLSEWADEHFYLSAESAAQPGRWTTLPYQRGIMDAITDPRVERVSLRKSSRVGATKMMNATVGYYMHQDPCPIMVVQPTIQDAEGYSKEEIAPMLRDCPVLAALVPEARAKNSNNTLQHKAFPGGVLSIVGANSGRGFRRVGVKVLLADEIEIYPASAGTEGDPLSLAIRRTQTYWDRKVFVASSPGIAGRSRITQMFEAGDQRLFFVPCPQCQHMDFLVFRQSEAGHFMLWPEGRPEEAHFVCSKNGCVIEHQHKRTMVERGEWRAQAPFAGHASFHIWAAYSYSANATWGDLATEFVAANKAGAEKLKTFVNTALGETWQERGDAPDHEKLYTRRETYPIGTVPKGVIFVTAGVDVQRDRLVCEVVGWGENRQSWSIAAEVLPGDTSGEVVWARLDELLDAPWPGEDGVLFTIKMLAIDSGFNTQQVYNWARRHPMSRVIACKGSASANVLIGSPSAVDVTVRGRKLARGYKVWTTGVSIGKAELFGWLRQDPPSLENGGEWPHGYCHFPEYAEDFFLQMTAEQLVPVVKRSGHTSFEWQLIGGRQNHFLDCRILARAAASLLGLDRLLRRAPVTMPQAAVPETLDVALAKPASSPTSPETKKKELPAERPGPKPKGGGWLRSGRRGGWLNRNR